MKFLILLFSFSAYAEDFSITIERRIPNEPAAILKVARTGEKCLLHGPQGEVKAAPANCAAILEKARTVNPAAIADAPVTGDVIYDRITFQENGKSWTKQIRTYAFRRCDRAGTCEDPSPSPLRDLVGEVSSLLP